MPPTPDQLELKPGNRVIVSEKGAESLRRTHGIPEPLPVGYSVHSGTQGEFRVLEEERTEEPKAKLYLAPNEDVLLKKY